MRQKQRDLFPRFPSSSSLFQQKATGGPPKKYTNINQRRPTPILYSLDQLCHSCRTPFDSAPIDNDDHPTGDPATSDDELGLPGTTAPQARPRPDIRRGSEHIVPCFLESAGCPQRTPSPSPRAVRTSPTCCKPDKDQPVVRNHHHKAQHSVGSREAGGVFATTDEEAAFPASNNAGNNTRSDIKDRALWDTGALKHIFNNPSWFIDLDYSQSSGLLSGTQNRITRPRRKWIQNCPRSLASFGTRARCTRTNRMIFWTTRYASSRAYVTIKAKPGSPLKFLSTTFGTFTLLPFSTMWT
ncbi:hypothetical protein OCS_01023 [Ophiocordyceps sinensis CO18]|uniref:Uncharacterized protein n=1 Tax=Ophiocordyceps sinensis (strain Co18 / CGMCC 3.14243) TaxID=911162 RepID=T5AN55_OPHSC|nr:hypothetical protein OCS_01023 [Ophiocordyceps sinensis CO18]